MDAVKIHLPAELGLLALTEGLLEFGGLGRVNGTDLGNLVALLRCQLEEDLFAGREQEESTVKLAFDLTESDTLGGGQYGQDPVIAGGLIAGEILEGNGGEKRIEQTLGGKHSYLGPALGPDHVDPGILNWGNLQVLVNLRLVEQDRHVGDAVGCGRGNRSS
jgi:hypothetical protein